MPHIAIEYSANLDAIVDIAALCDTVRRAGLGTGVFPLPGLRVRAHRADFYSIADGDPAHGFIDISIRLREGRPQEKKEAATQAVFNAAKEFLTPCMQSHSIALSLEMRDIDATLSPKTGTIRDHLPPELC